MGCNTAFYLYPSRNPAWRREDESEAQAELSVRARWPLGWLLLCLADEGKGSVVKGWGRREAGVGCQGSGGQDGNPKSLQAQGATEPGIPHSSQCPGRHKSEITGDIVSVQQVLLKWREIYGWHFVTINQELLINKVTSLFSWNLGGYENCQTDHFIHYFWLMHPDSLTLKEKKYFSTMQNHKYWMSLYTVNLGHS